VAVAREGGNSAGRSTPEVTEAVAASFNVGIHTGLWVVAGVSALAAVLAFAFVSRKAKAA
jgi:DHA2 family multidrug resistance protein-like MFS transporter